MEMYHKHCEPYKHNAFKKWPCKKGNFWQFFHVNVTKQECGTEDFENKLKHGLNRNDGDEGNERKQKGCHFNSITQYTGWICLSWCFLFTPSPFPDTSFMCYWFQLDLSPQQWILFRPTEMFSFSWLNELVVKMGSTSLSKVSTMKYGWPRNLSSVFMQLNKNKKTVAHAMCAEAPITCKTKGNCICYHEEACAGSLNVRAEVMSSKKNLKP